MSKSANGTSLADYLGPIAIVLILTAPLWWPIVAIRDAVARRRARKVAK